MKATVNTPVDITSMGFGRDMRAIPRRMEFGGKSINFVDNGLRTTVKQGTMESQILTMSDGERDFRLRSDNRGGTWTLLSIG